MLLKEIFLALVATGEAVMAEVAEAVAVKGEEISVSRNGSNVSSRSKSSITKGIGDYSRSSSGEVVVQ